MVYEIVLENPKGIVSLAVVNGNCLFYPMGDKGYCVPWVGSVGEGQARINAFQFNQGLEVFFENPSKSLEPKSGQRVVCSHGKRFVLGDLIRSVRDISEN